MGNHDSLWVSLDGWCVCQDCGEHLRIANGCLMMASGHVRIANWCITMAGGHVRIAYWCLRITNGCLSLADQTMFNIKASDCLPVMTVFFR